MGLSAKRKTKSEKQHPLQGKPTGSTHPQCPISNDNTINPIKSGNRKHKQRMYKKRTNSLLCSVYRCRQARKAMPRSSKRFGGLSCASAYRYSTAAAAAYAHARTRACISNDRSVSHRGDEGDESRVKVVRYHLRPADLAPGRLAAGLHRHNLLVA